MSIDALELINKQQFEIDHLKVIMKRLIAHEDCCRDFITSGDWEALQEAKRITD